MLLDDSGYEGMGMPLTLFVLSMVLCAFLAYLAGYLHGQVDKAEPLIKWFLRKG